MQGSIRDLRLMWQFYWIFVRANLVLAIKNQSCSKNSVYINVIVFLCTNAHKTKHMNYQKTVSGQVTDSYLAMTHFLFILL